MLRRKRSSASERSLGVGSRCITANGSPAATPIPGPRSGPTDAILRLAGEPTVSAVVTNTELGWKSVQLIGAWTLEQLLLVEAAKGNGADDNTLQKIRNYRKLGL